MKVNQPNTRNVPTANKIPRKFLFFKAVNEPYPANKVAKAKIMTSPFIRKPPLSNN